MRAKTSFKNVVASTILNVVTILAGLIAQAIFVSHLGVTYLGVNSLFTNLISVLGVVEVGLGSAIIFSLYKPLAERDVERIKSLMAFYKSGYRIVAFIVLVLGLIMMPFLKSIVGDASIDVSLQLIFGLFLADVIVSYLFSYKRSILIADQKQYIFSGIHVGYTILLNTLQILILVLTGNYILYLVIKVIVRFIENIVINVIIDRRYPLVVQNEVAPLEKSIKQDILRKVKGLFFHKIGAFVVNGTDNIVISVFFGIKVVGLYSNYFLIINAVNVLITQAFSAITANVGNLLVLKNEKQTFAAYKKVRFANFWLSSLVSIGVLVCLESFISLWVGSEYLLPFGVLLALVANLYLTLMRASVQSFKDAAGIFHEDRYIPVVESLVNVLASLVLLHFFGLAGVFMGTICSSLVIHLFSYPHFVYMKLFGESRRSYYMEFFKHLIVVSFAGALTLGITRMFYVDNVWMRLIIDILATLIVPNTLLYAMYHRTGELKYFMKLAVKIMYKIKHYV
jgi:O-antigen/teichoic acid export membrane protein